MLFYMRKDKPLATDMRRRGNSYLEIQKRLKIPKATLSDWFGGIHWSAKIKERLIEAATAKSTVRIRELDRVRGLHLKRIYEEAKEEARLEFKLLQYNPLFIAGLMLYWGEGDKRTHYQTRLVNTDAEMIRLFVFFLTRACRIPEDKIRASVTIYPDLNPSLCIEYWSNVSGINRKSFTKCVTILGRHKERKLTYGMCNVIISSTYFKTKILEWLRLLPKELMGKRYYDNMAVDAGMVQW